jgi:uncharacterized protein YceK
MKLHTFTKRARGAALLTGAAMLGCGTVNSYSSGCPAIFSGVRTDRTYLQDDERPASDFTSLLLVGGDLPLSALADLVTLPIGAWAAQAPPEPVSPGCRWAAPHELAGASERPAGG